MCTYMYICVCMNTHRICTNMYVCVYITCVHVCAYIPKSICGYVCVLHSLPVYKHMCVCVYLYLQTNTNLH